jgi:IS30 family transposase
MSPNRPKLTRRQRRLQVVELRAQGLTLQQIATHLQVNEKTIDRDIKSSEMRLMIEEIQRQQLDDIQHEEKSYVRMQFRDKLLEKLMPKKVEQQVSGLTPLQIVFDAGMKDDEESGDKQSPG